MMRYRTAGWLLLGLLVAAVLSGCAKEMHLTVTVNEDGSVEVGSKYTVSRAMIEQRVAMMDRFDDDMDDDDDDDDDMDDDDDDEDAEVGAAEKPKPAEQAGEKKEAPEQGKEAADPDAGKAEPAAKDEAAAKDTALAAKLRKMLEEDSPASQFDDAEFKIKSIDVAAEWVTIDTVLRFPDMNTYVAQGGELFDELGFERTVFDKDDQGKFRITMTPGESSRFKEMPAEQRQMMIASQAKVTLTFVMPGKIISSTLPDKKDNRTSFEVDATKPETFDAMGKVLSQPLVIVAEPGALKLDGLPLDSKELAWSRGDSGGVAGELPITDAGPGYRTVAMGVTTTVCHVFKEGRELLKDDPMSYAYEESSSCRIQCKLYAPRDRSLLGIGAARVTKAVDDLGREVGLTAESHSGYSEYYDGDDEDEHVLEFWCQLAAPPQGAEALELVEGEIVATSYASWQEHVIEAPQADAEKEIDLGDLEPGAKLVITKIKRRKRQEDYRGATVSVKLTGPKAVNGLRLQLKMEGFDDANSYESMSSRRGNETVTRKMTIQCESYSDRPAADEPKLRLVIRKPTDLKRERVKFKLEAIDLF